MDQIAHLLEVLKEEKGNGTPLFSELSCALQSVESILGTKESSRPYWAKVANACVMYVYESRGVGNLMRAFAEAVGYVNMHSRYDQDADMHPFVVAVRTAIPKIAAKSGLSYAQLSAAWSRSLARIATSSTSL